MLQKMTREQHKVLHILLTSDLSKAHVTRDGSGLATWAIVYSML